MSETTDGDRQTADKQAASKPKPTAQRANRSGSGNDKVAPPLSRAERLRGYAALLNDEHRAVEAAIGTMRKSNAESVRRGIRAGKILHAAKPDVKEEFGPKRFGDWIEHNFDGSHRTANLYMRMARRESEISQALANLGIEAVDRELREPKPKPSKVISDWASQRGAFLWRAVHDVLDISAVIEHAIGLAPADDRERMVRERDVMAKEVASFLNRPWPVTAEPADTLFAEDKNDAD